ncbi:PEP/pyruvate-binding domain-containing protein [Spirillospora sp. NPDC029432]|uniref:PEP/pyruvate-binding domain-containing protein n=1 Tax=Spirillospora sp. NPDC029432 TaxID=3154599 RepID=UPI003454C82B
MTQRTFVLPLDDAAAEPPVVGAKGAALARLGAAGLPVPAGFHVTAEAYRDFVERAGLRGAILSLTARVDPDLPVTAEAAARRIAELFEREDLPTEIAGPVRWSYAGLGDRDHPVAVRPSPVAGEPPGTAGPPFAGRHDTALGVRGEAALLAAIRRCWASLWSARAIEYRVRNGVDQGEVALGVVVQTMVPADAAGTMSTAAPVSGGPGRILLNATWGLGEPVAAGRVTPDTMVVEKGTGRVVGRRVADKPVMTVASDDPRDHGTRELDVPRRWREVPVLDDDQAAELGRLGERIEALCGLPMDIEWALHEGSPYILQACPAVESAEQEGSEDAEGTEGAAGAGADGRIEVWNDTLDVDHLWTRGGLGEAVPDVMTPCTWSLVQLFARASRSASALPGQRAYGNIGGHFYTDLSLIAALGAGEEAIEEEYGRLPAGVRIPRASLGAAGTVRKMLPEPARASRLARGGRVRPADFLAAAPARCEALRQRILEENDADGLLHLWGHDLLPFFLDACHVLESAGREGETSFAALRTDLERLAGGPDANAMMTGLSRPGTPALAVLGPVVGLSRVARGELSLDGYLRQWGHRGPHEFEIAVPRPAEDPAWIEEQLPAPGSGWDAVELMAAQREVSRAAWKRFRRYHPHRVAWARRRIGRWAQAVHDQESARSEVMRIFGALRAFVVRAGELTGRGDDLFYLTIDEVLALLDGDARPLGKVLARRRTYERYRALAPYPAVIRGRFDPVTWAGGRGRRMDYHDAEEPLAGLSEEPLNGTGATAGIVEGTVRVVERPEQAWTLAAGEILVAPAAGVGWTPLFPRAAALVTDVGAPLSPGVIVARELGLPAVVGCGNATTRLRTGDRIRVDGGRGEVELLSPAAEGSREPQLTTEG